MRGSGGEQACKRVKPGLLAFVTWEGDLVHERVERGAAVRTQPIDDGLPLEPRSLRDDVPPRAALDVRDVVVRADRWRTAVKQVYGAPLQLKRQREDLAAALR